MIEIFTKKTGKISRADKACQYWIKSFKSWDKVDIIPTVRGVFEILRPTKGVFHTFVSDFERMNGTTFNYEVVAAIEKAKEEKEQKRLEKEKKKEEEKKKVEESEKPKDNKKHTL